MLRIIPLRPDKRKRAANCFAARLVGKTEVYYFRFESAVRSAESLAVKVDPHQLEPNAV
jgi:hypothetical protein